MSAENLINTPEKRDGISDNDRKFTIKSIDSDFLAAHSASSYLLTTDWLETDEATETKLAKKEFNTGEVQLLHIKKVTIDNDRQSLKTPIDAHTYNDSKKQNMPHVQKRRYEFTFTQHGISFTAKYDEFANSTLRILEIDAATADERNEFNPIDFPYALIEVTGIKQFYGYHVAKLLAAT